MNTIMEDGILVQMLVEKAITDTTPEWLRLEVTARATHKRKKRRNESQEHYDTIPEYKNELEFSFAPYQDRGIYIHFVLKLDDVQRMVENFDAMVFRYEQEVGHE